MICFPNERCSSTCPSSSSGSALSYAVPHVRLITLEPISLMILPRSPRRLPLSPPSSVHRLPCATGKVSISFLAALTVLLSFRRIPLLSTVRAQDPVSPPQHPCRPPIAPSHPAPLPSRPAQLPLSTQRLLVSVTRAGSQMLAFARRLDNGPRGSSSVSNSSTLKLAAQAARSTVEKSEV